MRKLLSKNVRKIFGVKQREVFAYHRYPLNAFRKLPDFLIIGSQKAATTTLFSYLRDNNQVAPPVVKETHFFNMNYNRGFNYYRSFFPLFNSRKATFEATPDYLDHPLAPQLCNKHLSSLKLIVALRNPISRAFSHFNFVQSYNAAERKITFEQGLALEQERMQKAFKLMPQDRYNSARMFSNYGYLRKGLYYKHISNWLKYFSIDQFHFIEFNELRNDTNKVLKGLCEFLELPFEPVKQLQARNKVHYKNTMAPETAEQLNNYYREPNEQLFELISKEYSWNQ